MRIAVIDSGINKEFPDFNEKDIEGINVLDGSDDVTDENGHGTATAGEIFRINKKAKLLVIKALDRYGKSSLECILEALIYCLKRHDIDIINLSLSCEIEDNGVKEYLESIVNELERQGKMIVCSMDNKFKRGDRKNNFLAKTNHIISVIHEYSKKSYISYDSSNQYYILHNSFHLMPFVNGEYLFYKGNSCAAPQLCGLLSFMEEKSEKDLLKYQESRKVEIKTYDTKLEQLIKDYCRKNFGNCEYINIQSESCFRLLKFLEGKYDISLDYKQFSVEDFLSPKTLVEKCQDCM